MKKIVKVVLFIIIIVLIFSALYFIVINNKNVSNKIQFQGEIKSDESLKEKKIKLLINDDGIFSKYYLIATKKLESMTLDEKIAQVLLVRYPDENQEEILKNYQFGGYLFFAKDFNYLTKENVINRSKRLQEISKIPILTAVDEEGGVVVRISSHPKLRSLKFMSSRDLYRNGGLDRIREDTIEKSGLLSSLGINLNLAPVVDVSTNPTDYMYKRSIGEDENITSEFAKTVIETSKNSSVSYTLKHFPGYGNNVDTHTGNSIDNRSYDDIMNKDIKPFVEGIKVGAEAILVSHNTITSIDSINPASLSKEINNILREKLNFTGIVITDDIAMGATEKIENKTTKAIIAGNDLIITTDYLESINEIKSSLERKEIDEELLDKHVLRVLSWKYYKGMMN